MEKLSQYLERVLRQKNLSPKDLARKCGITDSYIGRIIKGNYGNISVATVEALARGLDVDPHEILAVVLERPPETTKPADPLLIIDLVQRLMVEPRSLEAVQELLKLSQRDREILLEFIKSLNVPRPSKKRGENKARRE